MIHVCQFLVGVEVSEISAYRYEGNLAEQFYHEVLDAQADFSIFDLNED